MGPLLYIIVKEFKNTLKELRKKPLTLVLYVFMLLFFTAMLVLTFIMPSGNVNQGSEKVFYAVVTVLLFIIFYFIMGKGVDRGSSFFRMSDVNLVFTAPISPQKVLIYGFVKQLFVSLIFLFFISFQIPNLKNNFIIKSYGTAIIYLGLFLLVIVNQIAGILLYSLASRRPSFRTWLKRGFNILMLALALGFIPLLLETKDFFNAAAAYMGHPLFDYFPIVGWFRVVLGAAVAGIGLSFWLNLAFIIIMLAVMIIILYSINLDYYEDVLAATEAREKKLRLARTGRQQSDFEDSKLRRVNQEYRGKGAKSVFFRQVLEHRKTGILFVNKNTLIVAFIGIASKYFYPGASMRTVLYFTVYMLFFFTMQGKLSQELGKPYIYMIPSSSSSKVFYATLADNLKNAVDGAVLFSIAGVVFKSDLLTVLLSVLAYTSFGAVFIYGDVLWRRFLGSVHSKNLSFLLKFLLVFFVILPGLGVSIAVGIIFSDIPSIDFYTLAILSLYNALASIAMILAGRRIFDTIEMQ